MFISKHSLNREPLKVNLQRFCALFDWLQAHVFSLSFASRIYLLIHLYAFGIALSWLEGFAEIIRKLIIMTIKRYRCICVYISAIKDFKM